VRQGNNFCPRLNCQFATQQTFNSKGQAGSAHLGTVSLYVEEGETSGAARVSLKVSQEADGKLRDPTIVSETAWTSDLSGEPRFSIYIETRISFFGGLGPTKEEMTLEKTTQNPPDSHCIWISTAPAPPRVRAQFCRAVFPCGLLVLCARFRVAAPLFDTRRRDQNATRGRKTRYSFPATAPSDALTVRPRRVRCALQTFPIQDDRLAFNKALKSRRRSETRWAANTPRWLLRRRATKSSALETMARRMRLLRSQPTLRPSRLCTCARPPHD